MYTITEKIDGTNACVVVTEDGRVGAQSRTRIVTPESDNYGFARWVAENEEELKKLGRGHHYGEWAGPGIQRGYNGDRKRFFLFNTHRPASSLPTCVAVVPILYNAVTDNVTMSVEECIATLEERGSKAFPGYDKPEGVIVYQHSARLTTKAFTKWGKEL
jgi:hypothetical protein